MITGHSRYLHCCSGITATTRVSLAAHAVVRHVSVTEAMELAKQIRKRNVFARHSWEISFYVNRAAELGDKTVIEILESGQPNEVLDWTRFTAEYLEKLVILSSTFATSRTELHRKLGRSPRYKLRSNLIIGPDYQFIRAQTERNLKAPGLIVDAPFARSFARNGFGILATLPFGGEVSDRIRAAIDWVYESRVDSNIEAALVKTAIAFERLLIFSESESLAKALSERAAFLLSELPNEREKLSSAVKRFYDMRSGVVHGSKKKLKNFSPRLLEAADRFVLLLCLRVAANRHAHWSSVESLRLWCERQKWGDAVTGVVSGFTRRALVGALRLAE